MLRSEAAGMIDLCTDSEDEAEDEGVTPAAFPAVVPAPAAATNTAAAAASVEAGSAAATVAPAGAAATAAPAAATAAPAAAEAAAPTGVAHTDLLMAMGYSEEASLRALSAVADAAATDEAIISTALDFLSEQASDDDAPPQQHGGVNTLASTPPPPPAAEPPPPPATQPGVSQEATERIDDDEQQLEQQVEMLMAMGYTDTARIKGLLRVAVGTGADERLSSAIALMDGEDENDMAAEPDEAERAAALAAGAAIGASVAKAFRDAHGKRVWECAEIRRYGPDSGHLLCYADGLQERVHLHELGDGEWRRCAAAAPVARKSVAQGSAASQKAGQRKRKRHCTAQVVSASASAAAATAAAAGSSDAAVVSEASAAAAATTAATAAAAAAAAAAADSAAAAAHEAMEALRLPPPHADRSTAEAVTTTLNELGLPQWHSPRQAVTEQSTGEEAAGSSAAVAGQAPIAAAGQTLPGIQVRTCEELGWAQILGLDVVPTQQWLRETMLRAQKTPDKGKRRETPRLAAVKLVADTACFSEPQKFDFVPWGGDNSMDPRNRKQKEKDRTLLLNREQYPRCLTEFFNIHFQQ